MTQLHVSLALNVTFVLALVVYGTAKFLAPKGVHAAGRPLRIDLDFGTISRTPTNSQPPADLFGTDFYDLRDIKSYHPEWERRVYEA